jgi:hypothetical protein
MNIFTLKNIMKEVNAPNSYEGVPSNKPNGDRYEFNHPLYWIFKIENIRIKTLDSRLRDKRKPHARFDIFLSFTGDDSNGAVFVRSEDYKYEQVGNDFYIKLIKANFPTEDRFFNTYTLSAKDDTIVIKGDIERIN